MSTLTLLLHLHIFMATFPFSSLRVAPCNCISTFPWEPWACEMASTAQRVPMTTCSRSGEGAREPLVSYCLWDCQINLLGKAAYKGKHSVCLLDLPLRWGPLPGITSECQVVCSVIKKVAQKTFKQKLAWMQISLWHISSSSSKLLDFFCYSAVVYWLSFFYSALGNEHCSCVSSLKQPFTPFGSMWSPWFGCQSSCVPPALPPLMGMYSGLQFIKMISQLCHVISRGSIRERYTSWPEIK